MLAQKPRNKINLLPQEEFSDTIIGRILHWGMGTFRILVIVVETIVMASFLSRFWLDARANDLNDTIKSKQSLIETQTEFEQKFLATQKQLKIFSQMANSEFLLAPYIESITSYLPSDIVLTSFSFTPEALDIKGKSVTETSIAQLLANLKKDSGLFSKVSLASLSTSNQEDNLLVFTVNLELNKEGGTE